MSNKPGHTRPFVRWRPYERKPPAAPVGQQASDVFHAYIRDPVNNPPPASNTFRRLAIDIIQWNKTHNGEVHPVLQYKQPVHKELVRPAPITDTAPPPVKKSGGIKPGGGASAPPPPLKRVRPAKPIGASTTTATPSSRSSSK